jgi:phosphoesterase RecJ-like protein
MMPEIRPLLAFFESYGSFIIVGHKEPDGDCVGSQLALASFLKRKGKAVTLVSPGPFKRVEVKAWASSFAPALPDAPKPETGLILLDCSSPSRAGDLEAGICQYPLAIIDHHASNDSDRGVLFVDPQASATALLILEIIESTGDSPSKEEAEFLLFGLCTDTGFFRHLGPGASRSLMGAARLSQAGASPKEVFARMYGGKSIESRRLIGEILGRLEPFYGGRLLLSFETLEDAERYGLEGRDSDSLYQLIQSVEGCEAIVIMRQETESNCTVGFRSKQAVDVSLIAGALGGGGHKQAAGLSISGRIEDVKERILCEFDRIFGIERT